MSNKNSYQDWLNKGCQINESGDEPDNAQQQRARELVEINHHEMALRILNCSTWFCRQRMCPACSLRLSHKRRSEIHAAVAQMKDPRLALFKLDSKDMKAPSLRLAINTLRASIR